MLTSDQVRVQTSLHDSITVWIAYPKEWTNEPYYFQAKKALKEYCETCLTVGSEDPPGLCVTLTNTEFIHKDGTEFGFAIGIVNYPRFPKAPHQLMDHAHKIALLLMDVLKQDSALIDSYTTTYWITRKEKLTPTTQDSSNAGDRKPGDVPAQA